jgi:hypothetical protein
MLKLEAVHIQAYPYQIMSKNKINISLDFPFNSLMGVMRIFFILVHRFIVKRSPGFF